MIKGLENFESGRTRFLRFPLYRSGGGFVELDYKKPEDQIFIRMYLELEHVKKKLNAVKAAIK